MTLLFAVSIPPSIGFSFLAVPFPYSRLKGNSNVRPVALPGELYAPVPFVFVRVSHSAPILPGLMNCTAVLVSLVRFFSSIPFPSLAASSFLCARLAIVRFRMSAFPSILLDLLGWCTYRVFLVRVADSTRLHGFFCCLVLPNCSIAMFLLTPLWCCHSWLVSLLVVSLFFCSGWFGLLASSSLNNLSDCGLFSETCWPNAVLRPKTLCAPLVESSAVYSAERRGACLEPHTA